MSYSVFDLSGNDPFRAVVVNDPKTLPANRASISLANSIASLAAGARTTPVYAVPGNSYIFFASFGGTSPSLQLQYIGDDGNYYNIDSARSTSGAGANGIVIGEGSNLVLYNAGANPITNLIAGLS